MRKKALQVLVAVSVFIFLMTSAMDTFAAKADPKQPGQSSSDSSKQRRL